MGAIAQNLLSAFSHIFFSLPSNSGWLVFWLPEDDKSYSTVRGMFNFTQYQFFDSNDFVDLMIPSSFSYFSGEIRLLDASITQTHHQIFVSVEGGSRTITLLARDEEEASSWTFHLLEAVEHTRAGL